MDTSVNQGFTVRTFLISAHSMGLGEVHRWSSTPDSRGAWTVDRQLGTDHALACSPWTGDGQSEPHRALGCDSFGDPHKPVALHTALVVHGPRSALHGPRSAVGFDLRGTPVGSDHLGQDIGLPRIPCRDEGDAIPSRTEARAEIGFVFRHGFGFEAA